MTTTIERGDQNEKIASDYLRLQGLSLVTSKYRSRYGEIDLIMRDKDVLVFVEVRYRRSNRFGGAAMSITPGKQRKIALTALQFLQKNKKTSHHCRFDVVAISERETEWIKSAFDSVI